MRTVTKITTCSNLRVCTNTYGIYTLADIFFTYPHYTTLHTPFIHHTHTISRAYQHFHHAQATSHHTLTIISNPYSQSTTHTLYLPYPPAKRSDRQSCAKIGRTLAGINWQGRCRSLTTDTGVPQLNLHIQSLLPEINLCIPNLISSRISSL